jgi:hypothetical protein
VIARLSRTLFGAIGTSALAMVFADIWRLADTMGWPRLLGLGIASVAVTVASLILVHGLWKRARQAEHRDRIVLFNLATTITLTLAGLTLYAGLFVASLACAAAVIPPDQLAAVVGHPVSLEDYLRLAWLSSTLGTIGGALGSLVERDDEVREAAYRSRGDARN